MPAPINNVQNSQPNSQLPTQQVAGASSATKAPVIAPFLRASKEHIEQGVSQNLAGAVWNSAAVSQQTFSVPSYGWLTGLILTISGSGGSKGGTVTVAGAPDAPANILSQAQLVDSNGTPIWQLDGYALYLARLLGGYRPFRPDLSTFGNTPIDGTASGAGTGNFKTKIEIPIAFRPDLLGSLPNMDGSALYRLNVTYNAASNFYNGSSNVPATPPSLTALLEGVYQSKANSVSAYGEANQTNPPAVGTVQYWSSQSFSVINGLNTLQLNRVGNVIRNHIFIFRDASNIRSNADSTGVTPSVIQFMIDAAIRYNVNVDTQRQRNFEAYGFDVPAGVISFPNTLDPDGIAGQEYGDNYLPTAASTTLKLQFTSSAAGSLQVLTNDIVPAGSLYPVML